jgi:membrane-associated protein
MAAVFTILLFESALPIGFVLPGDTLLLSAGLTCASGHLSLPWMLGAAAGGAVLGAQGGYLLGRLGTHAPLGGRRRQHIQRAVARFEQLSSRRGYGPALVAARFIPVARSVVGPVSGLLQIPAARFTVWQTAGGITWAATVTLAGYGVGRAAPGLEHYLPLFLILAALSFPITAGLGYLLLRLRTDCTAVGSPVNTRPVFDTETVRP